MPTVQEITLAHDRFVTATVSAYKARLTELVAAATARTLAELARRLAVDAKGAILPTAANRRVLRGVDRIFTDALDAAGLPALNRAYAGQFSGSLPYLDQIIDQLSQQLATPLPPAREALDAEAKRTLAAQQASTVDSLNAVADAAAANAKRGALFGFAGLDFGELSATLARAFGKTTQQATVIADSSMMAFFRTANAQVFEEIQADEPGGKPLRYKYQGPLDKKNRVFCRHLLLVAKTYTRAEIDAMDNGAQPRPIFIWCGGIGCRHVFSLSPS